MVQTAQERDGAAGWPSGVLRWLAPSEQRAPDASGRPLRPIAELSVSGRADRGKAQATALVGDAVRPGPDDAGGAESGRSSIEIDPSF